MKTNIFFSLKLREKFLYLLMRILTIFFPIKRNKVFFLSFSGKAYSDNPKAISEALYAKYGNKFEYTWAFRPSAVLTYLPQYVKTCKYNSITMIYHMCTSKVWVSNFTISRGTYKRKEQFYIQTWHGERGFKKCLHDDKNRKYSILFETDGADLMLAGSSFGEKFYRTAFSYKGEIMVKGCPRNDIFFQDTEILQKNIRERYGLMPTDKIVMYAPTFRKEFYNASQSIGCDLNKVAEILNKTTREKWKILVRSHTSNSNKGFEITLSNNIIPVTDYPDMNELLQITDILITDYSSSAGDFALSGKLILLCLFDKDEYRGNNRDFYFEIEDSPYYSVNTPEELYNFLARYENIDKTCNCKDILDFYKTDEKGVASDAVSTLIEKKIFSE